MGQEHLGNLMALSGAEVVAIADPHEPSRAQMRNLWSGGVGGSALRGIRPGDDGGDGNPGGKNGSSGPDNPGDTYPDNPGGNSGPGNPGGARPPLAEFDNHREMLSAGLCDAVVVSTPNFTHLDVMADVFATPCHVMVEKPLGLNVKECLKIMDLAEKANYGGLAWVGLEYRYMPPIARLIKEVQDGLVGQLKMVAIREHRFPFLDKVDNWNRFARSTGGTFVEKCCHFFDLMDIIAQARPAQVFASGSQAVNHLDERYGGECPDMLDNAYVVVEYANGVRGMLDLCMFADATHNQEEVVAVGDRGKVEAFVPEGIVRKGRRGQHWIGDVETQEVTDDRVAFEGGHSGASYLELLAFVEAIAGGREPEVTLLDGLWAVAVGQAGHLSIEKRRPVEMSEVMPKSLLGG